MPFRFQFTMYTMHWSKTARLIFPISRRRMPRSVSSGSMHCSSRSSSRCLPRLRRNWPLKQQPFITTSAMKCRNMRPSSWISCFPVRWVFFLQQQLMRKTPPIRHGMTERFLFVITWRMRQARTGLMSQHWRRMMPTWILRRFIRSWRRLFWTVWQTIQHLQKRCITICCCRICSMAMISAIWCMIRTFWRKRMTIMPLMLQEIWHRSSFCPIKSPNWKSPRHSLHSIRVPVLLSLRTRIPVLF